MEGERGCGTEISAPLSGNPGQDFTKKRAQVVRKVEQRVAYRLALGGGYLHGLQAGRIAVEAQSQWQGFVVHELVEAFHGTGGSAFDLHGKNSGVEFQQVIDFPGAATLAPPVEQLPIACEATAEQVELLGGHLLADASPNAGSQGFPAWEMAERGGVPQGMSQAHVQQGGLAQAVVFLRRERQAVGGRVRDELAKACRREHLQGTARGLQLHPVSHGAIDELFAQGGHHRKQHLAQDPGVDAPGVFGKIVLIGVQQVALEISAGFGIGSLRVRSHHRWHAADHLVAVEPLHGLPMDGCGDLHSRLP